jgi:hypothetical protein
MAAGIWASSMNAAREAILEKGENSLQGFAYLSRTAGFWEKSSGLDREYQT